MSIVVSTTLVRTIENFLNSELEVFLANSCSTAFVVEEPLIIVEKAARGPVVSSVVAPMVVGYLAGDFVAPRLRADDAVFGH